MSKPFRVPLDKHGNQLSYSEYDSKLVDPWEFKSHLKYIGYERGQSRLNIKWMDTKTTKIYRSSMDLLDVALIGERMTLSIISGTFGFKKQGTSVLLKVIEWN